MLQQSFKVSMLTLFALFCFTGCSSTKGYVGSPDSKEDVASVRANGCTFQSVNGIRMGSMDSVVEILPGQNELVLTVDSSNFNSVGPTDPTFKLKFNAEKGENYVVTGQRGVGKLCAWRIIPSNGLPDFTRSVGCIVRD